MSLLQELEDNKAKLAEMLEAEDAESEKVEEESPEKEKESVAEETKPAKEEKSAAVSEEKKETPDAEEKQTVAPAEEKPDDAAFARLRREAAASKKRALLLEEENNALKTPATAAPTEIATQEISPEVAEMLQDHRITKAEREFQTFEMQAKRKFPDFEEVTRAYTEALFGSLKVQNPRMSNMDIADRTKRIMLEKAGNFLNEGFENPVEEMYQEAKELGFKAKPIAAPAKEEEKEAKPDMGKVAANRKRNAGTAASSGESKTDLSAASIMRNGMPTNAEWMKMSAPQKAAILAEAQGR